MADEDPSSGDSTSSGGEDDHSPPPRGQWWPARAAAVREDHLAQAESLNNAAARVAAAQLQLRRGAGPTVYLNVYDLSNVGGADLTDTLASLNSTLMRSWDVGLFHAGVEVAGVEYSYGYCEEGTGVFACEPRDACGANFRQAIPMGRAPADARIIERRLARLVATWPGDTYTLLARNCCHFCDALCRSLGVGPIPAWVNGLAASVKGATEFPALFGAAPQIARAKPSIAVDVDDDDSDSDQTGTTHSDEAEDSFDSDASDRRPPRVDVGPLALGRGWAPDPTPPGALGRRHTSPSKGPAARHLHGASNGDGVSDSSETDEEASAIARWLTFRRSLATEEEEERRTSARPIVERAVAEERAVVVE